MEAADILRSHLHEVLNATPIDRRSWRECIRDVPVALITDSKSMYDFLHKRGSTPAEKRLRLDLEMIRDEMDEDGLKVMWVRSEQQLADALTKGGLAAMTYLLVVLGSGSFSLMEDDRLAEKINDYKTELKLEKFQDYRRRREATADATAKLQRILELEGQQPPEGENMDVDMDADGLVEGPRRAPQYPQGVEGGSCQLVEVAPVEHGP